MAQTIKAVSFSRLMDYETCPLRAKLSIIDKAPHPHDPNSPAERGNKVHDGLEKFVFHKGKSIPAEGKLHFEQEILTLRDIRMLGQAEGEQMWCFDRDWAPVPSDDYERTFIRIKLDALVRLSEMAATAIDYKTGKRAGNEIKHGQQVQLYAIGTFLRFPQLEEVFTELWYLDKDVLHKVRYRRDEALRHMKNWNERFMRMTTDTEFRPNPSTWNCSYCPHKVGYLGKTKVMGNAQCGLAP